MPLARRHRVLAALLAAFGLLLAQLAVAGYACPGEDAMAMAAMVADDAPCCGDGVADPEPALCAAHCQQGDRSLDKPATPSLAMATTAGASLAMPYAAGPPVAASRGEPRSLLARPTAPPLAVRHCRFRI